MRRWSRRSPMRTRDARRRAAVLLRRYRRICRELGFRVIGRVVQTPQFALRLRPNRVTRIEGVVMGGAGSTRVKLARRGGRRPGRPVRVAVVAQ